MALIVSKLKSVVEDDDCASITLRKAIKHTNYRTKEERSCKNSKIATSLRENSLCIIKFPNIYLQKFTNCHNWDEMTNGESWTEDRALACKC